MFGKIREIRPKKLYVAADGPKNSKDSTLCERVRSQILIDWDCEVKTLYRDKNLGCKIGVSSAIDWIFEFEDKAIILEDDTLPEISFFRFCEELLYKYENEKKIFSITGVNWQFGIKRGLASYYFSTYPGIWGWATWKDRWEAFDLNFTGLEEQIKGDFLSFMTNDEKEKQFHIENLRNTKLNNIDSWDFAWHYTYYKFKGLCIVPNSNLISNLGFDSRATHTKHINSWKANIISSDIKFPLIHPSKIARNLLADRAVARRNFLNRFTFVDRLRFKIYKMINK